MRLLRFLWNAIRVLLAVACLAFAPAAIAWAFATEHFARSWILLVSPVIGLGLIALWYLLLGWGRFSRRARNFGVFVLAVLVAGAVFKGFFRYDGSTSGASLPRYVWRWSAPPAEDLPEPAVPVNPEIPALDESLRGVVDSPQFYGPNRDGMWPEEDLTASFDWVANPPEEIWRRPVGLGWSGFAVAGRRAITQEQRGDEELVSCHDLMTGQPLWIHRDEARFYNDATGAKEMAGDGPRATPTIVGGRVYTFGATGILNCLDLETGEMIWSRDVLKENGYALPGWGKSSSPLVLAELGIVVVSGPEDGGPTLLAFRLDSGEPAWRYEGQGCSYSSPILATLGGTPQIVSVNRQDVSGVDPRTGRELWRFEWPGHNPKVGQPVILEGDRVLVTASYGAGSYLLQVGSVEGTWTVKPLWKSIRLKTKFSSATVRGGYAYGIDEGRFACVDLKDGSRVWKEGKYGFGQHLQVGGRLLVQAEDGFVVLVKASPEGFEELSRIEALDSMTWNTPTLAGRYLLVRNDKEAVCFRLGEGGR